MSNEHTEEENNFIENINEATEELQSENSLRNIISGKLKYPVRELVTYLDYDSAVRSFELQEQIIELNNEIELVQQLGSDSIAGDEAEPYLARRDALTQELADLNDTIQDSRLEWTVRGVPPRVWKMIDKEARRKFPIARDADEHTRIEQNIVRNDFVNVETFRKGIVKLVMADGKEYTDISYEDAKYFWEEMPAESTIAVKNKIDELTFANKAFDQETASADFLSRS